MRSVMKHDFSKSPPPRVPRSVFNRSFGHKTTFNAGYLVPIFREEYLPGDTFSVSAEVMARLTTPVAPIMDNLFIDTFYFAVPNRLLWDNWEDFITGAGSHTVPVFNSFSCAEGSLSDFLGIPLGNIGANDVISLYHRAYNLIYNEWFRPQNVVDEIDVDTDDGPDDIADYVLKRRAKRHDYFTSCNPWPQAGTAIEIGLGDEAPVRGDGTGLNFDNGTTDRIYFGTNGSGVYAGDSSNIEDVGDPRPGTNPLPYDDVLGITQVSGESGLYADLTAATAQTINELREAFQLQRMLEKDARGGRRYTETILSHFGVINPDMRMQRPEYLGGSTSRINITPVPQTSETGTTEQGNLAAYGVCYSNQARWVKSFTEFGVIIGLACVRADLTYQQGLPREFSRQTRYDYYWPSLAHLGEQEVLNKEIYYQGTSADDDVFGYQERFAEYRYHNSQISGAMRSDAATPLDVWHLAQDFGSLPTLNESFLQEDPPMSRVLAVNEDDIKLDSYFNIRAARPMPTYSVPGLIDHF